MISTPLSLLFQRMRLPLVVLIGAYAVATLGYTLIPGYDEAGEPWRMGFLHAFYVVSYTGSTIGFGEVPAEFSDAQRMWTLVCIYLTVFAWLFAIGSLVGLVRDEAFHEALSRRRLQRSLRAISAPFYLVCGYGGSGAMLVDNLIRSARRAVVVDISAEAIREVQLRDYSVEVPAFHDDASIPASLLKAGLQNRWCAGLLALTDSDETNLKIALTGRLLNQKLFVAARASTAAAARNMASFDTGFVIRPAAEFALQASLAITRPHAYRLHERLTRAGERHVWEADARLDGPWLVCGQDDFGRLLAERLHRSGVAVRIIAEDSDPQFWPPGSVAGPSSQGEVLERAGIANATGVVVSHASDADNLSTIMTARMLDPEVLVIARENHLHNRALFKEAGSDLICSVNAIGASAVRPVLEAPLVPAFIERMLEEDEDWNRRCLEQIEALMGDRRLEFWSSRVSDKRTPALAAAVAAGHRFNAGMLTLDPRDRSQRLPALVLMILRDERHLLLPADDEPLETGDRILFCGTPVSAELIWAVAEDPDVVHYLRTGRPRPRRRLLPRERQPAKPADEGGAA